MAICILSRMVSRRVNSGPPPEFALREPSCSRCRWPRITVRSPVILTVVRNLPYDDFPDDGHIALRPSDHRQECTQLSDFLTNRDNLDPIFWRIRGVRIIRCRCVIRSLCAIQGTARFALSGPPDWVIRFASSRYRIAPSFLAGWIHVTIGSPKRRE